MLSWPTVTKDRAKGTQANGCENPNLTGTDRGTDEQGGKKIIDIKKPKTRSRLTKQDDLQIPATNADAANFSSSLNAEMSI